LAGSLAGAPPTDLDLLRRVRVWACLSGPERCAPTQTSLRDHGRS